MAKYKAEVEHPELHRHRLISGEDEYFVRKKAQALKALWDEQWAKRVAREKKLSEKKTPGEIAAERTKQAKEAILEIHTLLEKALVRKPLDWESLRETLPFDKPFPSTPVLRELPPEPDAKDPRFTASIGLVDKLLPGKQEKLQNTADAAFAQAHQQWWEIKNGNDILEEDYANDCTQWEEDQKAYLNSQAENNKAREERLKDFRAKKPETVLEYFEMVLYSGRDADYFAHQFQIEYNSFKKTLIVDYGLPEFKSVPALQEVRQSPPGQLEEIFFDEETQTLHYVSLAYQTALKTIHELFQSDSTNLLETVVFNGMVEKMDEAGKKDSVCILSLDASRKEFFTLNFNQIDAIDSFKWLKGRVSPQLSLATPITPLKKMGQVLTKWGGREELLLTSMQGAIGLELMLGDETSGEGKGQNG